MEDTVDKLCLHRRLVAIVLAKLVRRLQLLRTPLHPRRFQRVNLDAMDGEQGMLAPASL